MEKIFQDPTFLEQPLPVRKKVVQNYFREHIANDPEFKKLPEEQKFKVFQNFFKENLQGTPDVNDDKVLIEAAKANPDIKQKLIDKVSQDEDMFDKVAQFQQMQPEERQKASEQAFPEDRGGYGFVEGQETDVNDLASLAERATFDYSQLANLAKAYYQQWHSGKVDPELEVKLEQQRERTLKTLVEAFDKEGYDLLQEGDKLIAIHRKTGKKDVIDKSFIDSIIQGLKTSKYEIASATGGAIAGAKIGKNFGVAGAIIGGLIGSAIGAGLGAAADYYEANTRLGKEPEDIKGQVTSAAVADLAFNTLLLGVGGIAKGTLKGIGKAKDVALDKASSYIEKKALQQLYKDMDVSDDVAEQWYKEFIKNYDYVPTTAREKRQLKALAVALRHPQATAVIEQAIKDNPKAAINISKEISIRADRLLNYVKQHGYEPEVVKKVIDKEAKKAGKAYGKAEEIVKEAIGDKKITIDDLDIDKVLNGLQERAGDPNLETKIKALKNTLDTIIKSNDNSAAALMETRKQLNDFYRRNARNFEYAPDKQAFRSLIENIDKKIEDTLAETGNADILPHYKEAVSVYKDVAKAKDTPTYQRLAKEGITADEADTAMRKSVTAIDDVFYKLKKPMSPADRVKTEVGALKTIIEKHVSGGGSKSKAIDWDGLKDSLEAVKKNVKTKNAKQIIKLVEDLDKFYAKDPILQAVASRTAAKAPATIAQTLSGKLQQTWNKLRFEFLLRNIPISEYSKRLKYQRLIESALEKEMPLKEFALRVSKLGDKELKSQADKLLNTLKLVEKLQKDRKLADKVNKELAPIEKETDIGIPESAKIEKANEELNTAFNKKETTLSEGGVVDKDPIEEERVKDLLKYTLDNARNISAKDKRYRYKKETEGFLNYNTDEYVRPTYSENRMADFALSKGKVKRIEKLMKEGKPLPDDLKADLYHDMMYFLENPEYAKDIERIVGEKDWKPKLENYIQSHPAVAGALMGFEQDEDGKWHYNVEKGILGALGAAVAGKALTNKQLRNFVKMAIKKEGQKLHDKLLNSMFSPVKNIVEHSPQQAGFYLKSKKVLEKVKNQTFTREQLINYLKKNGVKDEEIEWVVEPAIDGMKKIKIADIYDKLRAPKLEHKNAGDAYKDYALVKDKYRAELTRISEEDVGGSYYSQHWRNKNVLYHKRLAETGKRELIKEGAKERRLLKLKRDRELSRKYEEAFGVSSYAERGGREVINFYNVDGVKKFLEQHGATNNDVYKKLDKLKDVLNRYYGVRYDKIKELFPNALEEFVGFNTSSKGLHVMYIIGTPYLVIGRANLNGANRGIVIPILDSGIMFTTRPIKALKSEFTKRIAIAADVLKKNGAEPAIGYIRVKNKDKFTKFLKKIGYDKLADVIDNVANIRNADGNYWISEFADDKTRVKKINIYNGHIVGFTEDGRSVIVYETKLPQRLLSKLAGKQEKLPPKYKTTKSIVVEEVQSDWHKAGAKEGYSDLKKIVRRYRKTIDEINNILKKHNVDYTFTGNTEEASKKLAREREYIFDQVRRQLRKIDDKKLLLRIKRYLNEYVDGKTDSIDKIEGIKDELIKAGVEYDPLIKYTKQSRDIFDDEKRVAQLSERFERIREKYLKNVRESAVPSAPFKKTWHEKALKDVILEAVNKDYNRIYWTSGDVQSKRYNLGNYLNEVVAKKTDDGIVIEAYATNGRYIHHKVKNENELGDIVGQVLARDISKELKRSDKVVLRGDDLYRPSKGMSNFYDKIVNNTIKKIFKKFKVEPKQAKLKGEKYWYIDITPEMKEYIKKNGLPLFSIPIILYNVKTEGGDK